MNILFTVFTILDYWISVPETVSLTQRCLRLLRGFTRQRSFIYHGSYFYLFCRDYWGPIFLIFLAAMQYASLTMVFFWFVGILLSVVCQYYCRHHASWFHAQEENNIKLSFFLNTYVYNALAPKATTSYGDGPLALNKLINPPHTQYIRLLQH